MIERDSALAHRFRIGDRAPDEIVEPESAEELASYLRTRPPGAGLCVPAGSGSRLAALAAPGRYETALSIRRLKSVRAHETADLTATVEAGITLGELNRYLAEHGQQLAVDAPQPDTATIGAILSADVSGPCRYAYGKVRDALIGVRVVLADGTLVKGGGQVVKNVAGYDLMKLFTGSRGSLGVIVEASFKLRPVAAQTAWWVTPVESFGDAVAACLSWRDLAIEPIALEALDPGGARACGESGALAVVGFAGSKVEIESQLDEMRKAAPSGRVVEGSSLYESLRDFRCGGGADAWVARWSGPPDALAAQVESLRREAASLGADVAVVAHAGNGVAWLRWTCVEEAGEAVVTVMRRALAPGSWLVIDALPASASGRIDIVGPLRAPRLQDGIKRALDPNRVFPGWI